MSIEEALADFENYYNVVKKIKGLEAKKRLTIKEKEKLRFYRANKLKQMMILEGFYGYHPDDDIVKPPSP